MSFLPVDETSLRVESFAFEDRIVSSPGGPYFERSSRGKAKGDDERKRCPLPQESGDSGIILPPFRSKHAGALLRVCFARCELTSAKTPFYARLWLIEAMRL